jgi:hypothetical protein
MSDLIKIQENAGQRASGEFRVHYHLRDGAHHMNAEIRNKAEGELLALLRETSSALGISVQVDTRAYGEGGVIEYLDLLFQQKEQIGFVMAVLGPLLGTPFYLSKLRQSKQQIVMNDLTIKKLKLELSEKAEAIAEKSETKRLVATSDPLPLDPPLTPEQIVEALLSRKKVARRRSNYYAALVEDLRIEAVGFAPAHQRGAEEQLVQRFAFTDFIIDRVDLEPQTFKSIPIEVVAPVLRTGSIKWKGIFDKKVISFDLHDGNFRAQVNSKQVKFQNGTILICDLEVLQREDETGDTEIIGFVVTRVHEVRSPSATAETQTGEQLPLGFGSSSTAE